MNNPKPAVSAKPTQTRTAAGNVPAERNTEKPSAADRTGHLGVREIPLDDIIVRPGHNARESFDPVKLAQLRDSMAEIGLQQAVGVTPAYAGKTPGEQPIVGKWFLTYGERRLRAARDLGWKTILAVPGNDEQRRGIAENFDRENLLAWERVKLVVRMRDQNIKNTEIAKELGISPEAVSNDYTIGTRLIPEIFEAWKAHPAATTRIAIDLSKLEPDEQRKGWEEFLKGAPAEAGKRVKRANGDVSSKPGKGQQQAMYADVVRASAVPGKEGVQDYLMGWRHAMEFMTGAEGVRMPPEVEAHVKAIKNNAESVPTLPGSKPKAK